jgi:phosphotransferase system enzyme I (PtsI)
MVPQRIIKGTAVAPGLAIGPVHVVRAALNSVPTWTVAEDQLGRERMRLLEAIDQADEELRRRHRLVSQQSGDKEAEIFSFHRHMLADPGLRQRAEATIRDERINAEAAVEQLIMGLMAKVSGLEGDNVRSYASDFADPWRLVLDMLMSHEREGLVGTGEKVVLAAAELTPQVATFLERERIAGIITETGGRFSHGAVLARSFGIPCVVGLPNLLSRLEQGMRVSVDGDRGSVQLKPEAADVDQFLARVERRRAREKALAVHAGLPSVTTDGQAFGVLASRACATSIPSMSRTPMVSACCAPSSSTWNATSSPARRSSTACTAARWSNSAVAG